MTRRLPRFIRILLIPVAVIGVGAVAFAGSTGFNPADHHQMILQHISSELDLDDDQLVRLEQILEENRAEGEALHADHDALRDRAVALLTAPVIDSDAVEAQRLEALQLADKASALMSDAVLDAADVLTYEQRVQLAEKLEAFNNDGGPASHFEKMRQRMHH